jgi:hypothetical protein
MYQPMEGPERPGRLGGTLMRLLPLVPLERRAHFVLSACARGDLELHGVLPPRLALRYRLRIEPVRVPDDHGVAALLVILEDPTPGSLKQWPLPTDALGVSAERGSLGSPTAWHWMGGDCR